MSHEFQITVDARDPRALSTFWRDALGYVHPGPPGVEVRDGVDPLEVWDQFLAQIGVPEAQRNTRSAIEDPQAVGPRMFFQRSDAAKVGKNRIHLDVRAAPGLTGEARMSALEREAARLVGLGARRLGRYEPEPPLEMGHIVMADPEGNEFCLD